MCVGTPWRCFSSVFWVCVLCTQHITRATSPVKDPQPRSVTRLTFVLGPFGQSVAAFTSVLGCVLPTLENHQGDPPGGDPGPDRSPPRCRIGPLRPIGRCNHFVFGSIPHPAPGQSRRSLPRSNRSPGRSRISPFTRQLVTWVTWGLQRWFNYIPDHLTSHQSHEPVASAEGKGKNSFPESSGVWIGPE